jgi:transcriptional regulator with XRE-family HTH domain
MKPHNLIADLRKIRQDSRISQDAIGAALGSPRNVITEWELGQHSPKISTLSAWADALGYEIVLQPKAGTKFFD